MKSKKLGIVLIIIGVIFLVILILFKLQINNLIDLGMQASGGTCFLENKGECIHEKIGRQVSIPMYIGIGIIVATLSLGFYLIFFEKSQEVMQKTHEELIKNIGDVKKKEDKDEKFKYLLKGLDEHEQKVLNFVREQDGITQATLRIRADMSKTMLSFVLSSLEKKNLIKKVPKGKTNQIYLKFS